MEIYDTAQRLENVRVENLHEFIDWWLFWKAYNALHFQKSNRTITSLENAVKFTLPQNNISVDLVPVVLAKAFHIQSLCEEDQDLHDFLWLSEGSCLLITSMPSGIHLIAFWLLLEFPLPLLLLMATPILTPLSSTAAK